MAALSSVYLFPCPPPAPFQETIIIQIIAVIYSAIRAARCGGPGAETDEHRQGGQGGGPQPPYFLAAWPAFVLFEVCTRPDTSASSESQERVCTCVRPGEGDAGLRMVELLCPCLGGGALLVVESVPTHEH